jgi:hypothetical protein
MLFPPLKLTFPTAIPFTLTLAAPLGGDLATFGAPRVIKEVIVHVGSVKSG